jgi:hypothetical protein
MVGRDFTGLARIELWSVLELYARVMPTVPIVEIHVAECDDPRCG